jgi:uncharacterized membrane protein
MISDAQRQRLAHYQAQRARYLEVRNTRTEGGIRMESRAKIAGHPVHPMLIVFPLGLLATAVVFDVIYLVSGNGKWAEISYWMIAAGLIGGLLAAVPGWIDWLAIPSDTRAKGVGLAHGLGNMIVIIMFVLSWMLRRGDVTSPGTVAFILSFGGAALAIVTGWLGGELVERLGVGVDRGAHLNSPNSLSGRPASDSDAPDSGSPGRAVRT